MLNNPYEVLGISPNASNDEVKKAYRDLSRKYHPDSYVDNPLADLAEEKFKEVQEAYDQIMKERDGGYQSGYQSGSYQQNSGYQYQGASEEEQRQYQVASNYLNGRQYQQALNVLSGMKNRGAHWYYLSAIANMGLGNNMNALNLAKQAVSMEPGNAEYNNLVNRLQWNTQRYQGMGNPYGAGSGSSCGTGNFCCDLWCADSLLNVWEETFVHAYKCKKNGCFRYFNGSDGFVSVFWRDFGIQYLVFTCRSSVLRRNYYKRIRTKNGSCIFYRKCDFKFAFYSSKTALYYFCFDGRLHCFN